jgi:hypothetical protein
MGLAWWSFQVTSLFGCTLFPGTKSKGSHLQNKHSCRIICLFCLWKHKCQFHLLMRQERMQEWGSHSNHPHECGFHLVMRQDSMPESASHFPACIAVTKGQGSIPLSERKSCAIIQLGLCHPLCRTLPTKKLHLSPNPVVQSHHLWHKSVLYWIPVIAGCIEKSTAKHQNNSRSSFLCVLCGDFTWHWNERNLRICSTSASCYVRSSLMHRF